MKEPFPHDIRAVLAAPGRGLSLKKIFATVFFLLLSYLVYTVFTYLALLYDGVSYEYIRQSYGLFPFRFFPFDAAIASVLHLIGIAAGTLGLSLAIMSVAVITFEELRGDHFYSAFSAIRFAFSRLSTLLLGYISLAAFVGFIHLLGLIVGLIGRVPIIGEAAIGLFYVIPIFITLIFTLFVVFVSILGIILLPIILASQRKKEVFDGLLQLFSVVIREPVRFLWYTAVSAVLAKIASFVFGYMFFRTLQFSYFILKQGGGEKVKRLFNAAMDLLPLDASAVTFITTIFPGIAFSFNIDRWGYGAPTIGAYLLAISIFILFVTICGYMLSVFSSGLACGYAVIRRMKDDYLIVEEEPMESGEDYANPPFKTNNQTS
ncbi:MAG: hypothetical protein GY841_18160 [FCB group bacterium]|nr:hypothetical protein [FCB group bacterium]